MFPSPSQRFALGPSLSRKRERGKTIPLLLALLQLLAGERALGAGADFLKTSTGKVGQGATLDATRVLLEVVRDAGHGAVKASGGVRTAAQAAEYLALADEVMGAGWATPERFRIGASSLVDDILARLGAPR